MLPPVIFGQVGVEMRIARAGAPAGARRRMPRGGRSGVATCTPWRPSKA